MQTSEGEAKEEVLVEEGVKLHAITMENQVTMLEIVWKLSRYVDIVRDKNIMWGNILS